MKLRAYNCSATIGSFGTGLIKISGHSVIDHNKNEYNFPELLRPTGLRSLYSMPILNIYDMCSHDHEILSIVEC